MKKALAVALADYLPVFGAIFGVTLFGVSTYFGNVAMFLLSIVVIAVLPPTLEEVGRSLKEKYETIQNEVDIIAMIPEWSLGLEALLGIVIIVVSAVLKNIVISYLGAWLLALSGSLSMAKEINGLKEDLRSPDLERRRAAMEKVKLDEQAGAVISSALLLCVLLSLLFGSANFTQVELDIMILVMLFTFPLPALIVFGQSYKVMPPEPEKAARAAS
jgi:hypothetical protein